MVVALAVGCFKKIYLLMACQRESISYLARMASPVISLSAAALLFDEQITGLQLLGFALVLPGVMLLRLPLTQWLRGLNGRSS